MSSARRLYRVNLGLAVLGGAAVALAALAALTRVKPAVPSVDALLAACRRAVPLEPGLGMLVVLALISLGLVVLTLAARSLVRQIRAQRRFLGALNPLEVIEIDGHEVGVIEGSRSHAFCAGLVRPRIYLSTAAREALSDSELRAVIAHEAHHRASRDPLRILVARLLADALFFLPGLRRLSERYRQLAELAADEAAAQAKGRSVLASALLCFETEGEGETAPVVGIAPERIDHLLGQGPRWRLPFSLFAGSLVILAALLGLALTTPTLTQPETVSLAAVLAKGCMVAMAIFPVAMTAGAIYLSRARLRRRSPAPR